ncbi:uracil phosphoribosyltransferase [Hyphodiscus hymeniophilus]|uniref:uracil phosphoribosyltransferase n=1 Tax=Hyphodiscus hymeniophilus TaxID=353542 RepID=A0A9P6SJQ2_9HELO|nr:uracil phosphoribosyltransferase [Hyphodiscus hymeniophilus]
MTPNVTVISHPLLAAKLECIQDRATDSATMRQLVAQATKIMAVIATSSIEPGQTCALVPLMRSGLAMVDPVLEIMVPGSKVKVHHLGLFREKTTLQAIEYYNNIQTSEMPVPHAIIVDPLLATGNTSAAAIDTLKDWGVGQITFIALIATEQGLERAAKVWPGKVNFFVGAIKGLDGTGHITSGVGDIGDRLYLS